MKKLALLLLAAAVACGGSSTEPTTTVSGTFTLRTINGSPLPQSIYSDPDASLSINSGTLTLGSDRTYTLVEEEHVVVSGSATDDVYSESGTFTVSGNNLELTGPLISGSPIHHHMTWNGTEIMWTDVFISTTSTYVFSR
jgi:hypothetical protein